MTVIGYARVSKEEQAREGLSLPDQRQAIARYCELKDLPAPDILADEGRSGTSVARRPQASELVERVRCGEVRHVVATALDRLFRSTLDAVTFFDLAKKQGVAIHLIRESLDTSTPMGEFTATIMAALAQLESQRTGERIRNVLAYKRGQNGGRAVNGQAPYGWYWDRGTLRPHQNEQNTLRRIQELREGESNWSAIARTLNDAGTSPRRGRQWYHHQVRTVAERAEAIAGAA